MNVGPVRPPAAHASEPGHPPTLAALLDNDRNKLDLAFSLLFTLPGAPILYYGDEIGMGDNIWLEDRNGVRTPMQWNASLVAGFTTAGSAYAPVIMVRRSSCSITWEASLKYMQMPLDQASTIGLLCSPAMNTYREGTKGRSS